MESLLPNIASPHRIHRPQPTPVGPSVDSEEWSWEVKIYTLDRFTVVLANENTLSFNGKAQRRPLELLKVLIAHGGLEVGVQLLIDALWAESDGDAGYIALHTTLHRLRKLLGCKQAVVLNGGRLSLDARFVWLDIWAFERLAGRLDIALIEAQDSDISRHTRQLCHLYREPFLKEHLTPWAEARRERLHNHFTRALRTTGDYWEQRGQWPQAVELYQRGLELDRSSEEFCRRLMVAYIQLGCNGEALTVYRRCCAVLQAAFGIAPSPETEAVRVSLGGV